MSSEERLSLEVADSLDGQRIDRVLSLLLEVSRAAANEVLAAGQVTVDGVVVTKPSQRVVLGQQLSIPSTVESHDVVADASVDVEVVFADEHVIVVNKPSGLVVHPGAGVSMGTLVQGLLARYPGLADVGERGRPGIVHRLDRGTSGLLMVARSQPAYLQLTDQLRNRTVGRHYLALVHGEPQSHEGVIDAPIGRSLRHPTRQTVRADGKPARTSYEVLERFGVEVAGEPLALLRFVLETGRTHQIRVHADAIGLPLVGDDRYGNLPVPSVVAPLARPMLHARYLGFQHPTGEWMEFTREVPKDFSDVLDRLGSTAGSE
ncbi:MAG: RluA family pseudouridine synthase [Acidimicrobiales bacterium]